MTETQPLISCICVTRGKPLFLERAIRCFVSQTYANKQLVILFEDDDPETAAFLKTLPPDPAFKIVEAQRSTLGQLRNMAIQAADGDFVCQWDDDDWFHAARLEYLYAVSVASGRPGVVMMRWILFDATSGRGYTSHLRLWEGSILCRKNILPAEGYENKSIGEDTSLIKGLFDDDLLYPLTQAPHLYVYVYHGGNTWNAAHWAPIFAASTRLPEETNRELAGILDQRYDPVEGSLLLDRLLGIEILEE